MEFAAASVAISWPALYAAVAEVIANLDIGLVDVADKEPPNSIGLQLESSAYGPEWSVAL